MSRQPDTLLRAAQTTAIPRTAHHSAPQATTGADSTSHTKPTIRRERLLGTNPPSADTLALIPGDSLSGMDSLQLVDTLLRVRNPYRDVEAEAFFGTSTTLAPQLQQAAGEKEPVTGVIILQGFVLLLVVLGLRFMTQNALEMRFLFTQPFLDAITGKQRLYDEQGNLGYLRFLNIAGILGLIFFACSFAAYTAQVVEQPLAEIHGPLLITLNGIVLLLGIGLYQFVILRAAGLITLTQPFVRLLLLLKRTYFSLIVLAVAPLFLFTIFTPEISRGVWEWLIIAELCLLIVMYLKESLTLFLSQKLSILHWFLYLCIVECLPISFIVLIATGK